MVRVSLVFLLAMAISLTAFAADKIDVANIDKNVRNDMIKKVAATPEVTEAYQYYEIRGNDAKELRRQMTRNGTKWDDGRTYDSVTSWNVKWDYDYNCTQDGCTADSFKTIVDITFRFPKWIRTDEAPQDLTAKWDTYMKNLITHENGHRDMAVEAAADISRAVAALPPAASREELDREIDNLTNQRTVKLNSDERAYDATTIHGTTQGAVFP